MLVTTSQAKPDATCIWGDIRDPLDHVCEFLSLRELPALVRTCHFARDLIVHTETIMLAFGRNANIQERTPTYKILRERAIIKRLGKERYRQLCLKVPPLYICDLLGNSRLLGEYRYEILTKAVEAGFFDLAAILLTGMRVQSEQAEELVSLAISTCVSNPNRGLPYGHANPGMTSEFYLAPFIENLCCACTLTQASRHRIILNLISSQYRHRSCFVVHFAHKVPVSPTIAYVAFKTAAARLDWETCHQFLETSPEEEWVSYKNPGRIERLTTSLYGSFAQFLELSDISHMMQCSRYLRTLCYQSSSLWKSFADRMILEAPPAGFSLNSWGHIRSATLMTRRFIALSVRGNKVEPSRIQFEGVECYAPMRSGTLDAAAHYRRESRLISKKFFNEEIVRLLSRGDIRGICALMQVPSFEKLEIGLQLALYARHHREHQVERLLPLCEISDRVRALKSLSENLNNSESTLQVFVRAAQKGLIPKDSLEVPFLAAINGRNTDIWTSLIEFQSEASRGKAVIFFLQYSWPLSREEEIIPFLRLLSLKFPLRDRIEGIGICASDGANMDPNIQKKYPDVLNALLKFLPKAHVGEAVILILQTYQTNHHPDWHHSCKSNAHNWVFKNFGLFDLKSLSRKQREDAIVEAAKNEFSKVIHQLADSGPFDESNAIARIKSFFGSRKEGAEMISEVKSLSGRLWFKATSIWKRL